MPNTERTSTNIVVSDDGVMTVAETLVVEDENGVEVARGKPHSYVIMPGESPRNSNELVADVQNVNLHKQSRVDAHNTKRAARAAGAPKTAE